MLAESSVTVAPVNGGEVDEESCLTCDDVLDGTLRSGPFFCAFSGTVGPDGAIFFFVVEAAGPPIDVVCRAGWEVAIEEGRLSGKDVNEPTFNPRSKSNMSVNGWDREVRTRWRGGRRINQRRLLSCRQTQFLARSRSAHQGQ